MLKKYRPITPGTRQLILPMNEELTRQDGKRKTVKPTKSLLLPKTFIYPGKAESGSENNQGSRSLRSN